MKRTIVHLIAPDKRVDKEIIDLLEKKYGENTKIKIASSPRILSTESGLATFVQQNENAGIVFAIRNKPPRKVFRRALEAARDTGIPFYVLRKVRGNKWKNSRVTKKPNWETDNQKILLRSSH